MKSCLQKEVFSLEVHAFLHYTFSQIVSWSWWNPEHLIQWEISLRMSVCWLHHLGFKPVCHEKGIYIDSNEQDDVVKHCEELLKVLHELCFTHPSLPPCSNGLPKEFAKRKVTRKKRIIKRIMHRGGIASRCNYPMGRWRNKYSFLTRCWCTSLCFLQLMLIEGLLLWHEEQVFFSCTQCLQGVKNTSYILHFTIPLRMYS